VSATLHQFEKLAVGRIFDLKSDYEYAAKNKGSLPLNADALKEEFTSIEDGEQIYGKGMYCSSGEIPEPVAQLRNVWEQGLIFNMKGGENQTM
jgi:hypothetical protein